MKKKLFMPKGFSQWKQFFFWTLLLFIPLLISCSQEENLDRKDYVIFSETTEKEPLTSVYCNVEGGTKTFYVYSNVNFDYFFRTKEENGDWIKILSADYVEDMGATRFVVEVSPLTSFEKRTATLTLSSKENYLGQFIVFSQGFKSLFSDKFEWLGYGTSSPFENDKEVLIAKWTENQKTKGWSSSFVEGKDTAFCYGKNGYVRLGTEKVGADLLVPYVAGLSNEKVFLCSFNAVSYTSNIGVMDASKLTLKIEGGGEFSTGGTTRTIDLGSYNHEDTNLSSSMWNNSSYTCYVVSKEGNPITSNTRIRFITGESISQPAQRVLIDNVALYSVDEESYYLAGYESLNNK